LSQRLPVKDYGSQFLAR